MAAARRLAAIMFTDMVGFTASAQADEALALKLLEEQEKLVRPLFPAHQGREIKSTGDGFLVEFDSALCAVQCAIAIHQRLHERNAGEGVIPIRLRIGVHLGDVEERGGDIFGDSVNLAARIEPVAEPGGICISEPVFGQVRDKIPNKFERLEPKVLKNVRYPMVVYRVVLPWAAAGAPFGSPGPTGLAVLPFVNISPDPKDEYFADGLTEEMITVLSQMRGLRVIARTSVMPYKSRSKGVSQIGAELRVSSVLEGSVRKAGNRVRVTAQLIDAESESHLWAETYDRELDDIFAVQTELARQVADALRIELRPSEGARLGAKSVVRPDSYLAYLKGRSLLHNDTRASLEAAKEQFQLAISLDPKNAAAHSGLADVTRLTGWWFPEIPRSQWNEEGRRLAGRAIELDPNLAEAHASFALVQWDDYNHPAAEREFKLALSLNPSYSLAHHWYGALLEEENRAEEALVEFTLAEGADPLWPVNLALLAQLLLWLDRPEEALVKILKIRELDPSSPDYHTLLARYYLDRSELTLYVEERNRFLELFADPRRKPLIRALTYAVSGEKEKAREILRQEEAQADIGQTAYDLAHVAAELEDLDACFRWLQKAAANHELPLQPVRLDPRLQHVRDDPRFRALLKEINLD